MDLVTLALAKKFAGSGGGSGAGGTDVDSQIDEALSQAKAYTDAALTITEF